jgi:hypothetical protein
MSGCKFPRLHLNPALREAIAADGRSGWLLALLSGLHHAKFSALINSVSVPATTKNVERLARIANSIGFPVASLFIDEQSTVEDDTQPHGASL